MKIKNLFLRSSIAALAIFSFTGCNEDENATKPKKDISTETKAQDESLLPKEGIIPRSYFEKHPAEAEKILNICKNSKILTKDQMLTCRSARSFARVQAEIEATERHIQKK